MPYTAQFFAEKLNMPVEYFNPFRNLQIDPEVNLEELSRVAHGLGEVVGLGLRNLANCPVEMNLMPESTLRWQAFNQKKPYLIATVVSLSVVMFAIGFLFSKIAANKEQTTEDLKTQIGALQAKSDNFKKAYSKLQKSEAESDQLATLLQDRYYWGDFMGEMRLALIRSQDSIQKKLSAQKSGIAPGIWIEQMVSDPSLGGASTQPMNTGGDIPPPPPQPGPPTGQPGTTVTNSVIQLTCRAVSIKSIDPNSDTPDTQIAYAVETEIKNSPLVDAKNTQLTGSIMPDASNGTFTFTLSVTPTNAPTF
jgi:hypothetical protein